ncbi:MAG: hypothetical protein LQ348_005115 [Seirophora lacunosa]|nr:MAG: hypothetical protein LQ344_005624 [Seirophora lacunosa]KAI4113015.1 MAG: hypothetical protein LQ345_005922 [Seirophora villosa]KAI4180961.1 MAG: hypothetical protein LQ348_005115 [Seirophora lacunosa]
MPLIPRSSYYTKDYRQTAALIRARQPFLVKNIFTGIGIAAFAISVYAFTIKAVAQDDFSDVQIPNAPEQPPHTPHTGVLKVPPEVVGRQ